MKCTKKSSALADWPAVPRHDGMENFRAKDREPQPGRKEKGRLRSGPHKVKGPDRHVGSSEAKKETQSDPSTTLRDIMGGNNAIPPDFTGFKFENVGEPRTPEEYFYQLCLDTLQVSVYGYWPEDLALVDFDDLRLRAKKDWERDKHKTIIEAPDGTELQVLPHGGRGGYRVLLRGGDPLEIRALGQPGKPQFVLRFGARWCFEHSVEAIELWIIHFLVSLGFAPEEINVSEVHIRCDVPTSFELADIHRIRGLGTRNGAFQAYFDKSGFTGFSNVGTSGGLVYSVYNKRVEQKQKRSAYWPAAWHFYQIPEKTSIWRVEGRFKREKLLKLGVSALSDLKPEAIRKLWYYFTSRYLVLSDETDVRLERLEPTEVWSKIRDCGDSHKPVPIEVKIDGSQSHLAKVASGMIRGLAQKLGISKDEKLVADLVTAIAEKGLALGTGQLFDDTDALQNLVEAVIEKWPELHKCMGEDVKTLLISEVMDRVRSVPATRAFTKGASQSGKRRGADHV